jgi:hypothetical protein
LRKTSCVTSRASSGVAEVARDEAEEPELVAVDEEREELFLAPENPGDEIGVGRRFRGVHPAILPQPRTRELTWRARIPRGAAARGTAPGRGTPDRKVIA